MASSAAPVYGKGELSLSDPLNNQQGIAEHCRLCNFHIQNDCISAYKLQVALLQTRKMNTSTQQNVGAAPSDAQEAHIEKWSGIRQVAERFSQDLRIGDEAIPPVGVVV